MNKYMRIYLQRRDEAHKAFDLFEKLCGVRMYSVPGMATPVRLAWRIECGRSTQEAAAKEYIYRWNLALKSPIFGVPHSIGF